MVGEKKTCLCVGNMVDSKKMCIHREYMEKYIKATEKVVVRDVVDWKDEMIKKTKEVVEGAAND